MQQICCISSEHLFLITPTEGCFYPLDAGSKLNVHKMFRRLPGRHLNTLCTFKLRPLSRHKLNTLIFHEFLHENLSSRSTHPEVLLGKGVLKKICSKYTGENGYRFTGENGSHFGMGSPVVCCIFSEHLFLRAPLDGYLWSWLHCGENLFENLNFLHNCWFWNTH